MAAGLLLLGLLIGCCGPFAEVARCADLNLRPYRVLVVTDVRLRDPQVIRDGAEFSDIVALLKLWGMPFDILRLDTHSLALSDFVDGNLKPRYGAIIWTARQDLYPWRAQSYAVLAQAVNDYHISLIAISSRIQEPVIQGLLGVAYVDWGPVTAAMQFTATEHFITREVTGGTVSATETFYGGYGPRVTVSSPAVAVLATAGALPQLTAVTCDAATRTRAVWLGGNPYGLYATSPSFIRLLQRALVWSLGYSLYKDYGHSIVLRMDDPGSAQGSYLTSYLYPQLSAQQIHDRLTLPLQQYQAVLNVGFTPGFPWIPSRSIVHSVGVDYTDPQGTRQNIVSTYAGLLEGQSNDVLQIQDHGLTHQTPDLDTPPAGGTNWWDGSLTTEWPLTSWYREFYDSRRGREIDAPTQSNRLAQAVAWIQQDFGRPPLGLIPPGNTVSGARYIWPPGSSGVITAQVAGAAASVGYTVYYGNSNGWFSVGGFPTGTNGVGRGVWGLPARMLATVGTYFTFNRGPNTQFIAGPVTDLLGTSWSYPLRDYTQMTPGERVMFYEATETLQGGSIAGTMTSLSYTPPTIADNFTYKLAAQAGFGLASDSGTLYLGPDYVVDLPQCIAQPRTGNYLGILQTHFNRRVPGIFYLHDQDLVVSNTFLNVLLATLGNTWADVRYLGMDDWVGYLHAPLAAGSPTPRSAQFDFVYETEYCRYFDSHPSEWLLHLDDDLLADFRSLGSFDVIVDGTLAETLNATDLAETQLLVVPPGRQTHFIRLESPPPPPAAPVLAAIGDQIVAEDELLSFTVSAIDPNGAALTYSAGNLPDGAAFDASTQTFTWTPTAGQAGSYSNVSFTVSNGSLSDSETITITVTNVNQAPVLSPIGNQAVNENQLLSFTVSATDPDGDPLSYAATGLPAGASFDPATRTFSWTPSYSQAGSYSVTFSVSDGSLTGSETSTITVNNVNRPPVLNPIDNQTVNENQLLSFSISGTDPDGDPLTYSASGLPAGARFNAATRTFSWTPSYTQAGSYNVTFRVSDGALTSSQTITITVINVNRSPVLSPIGNKSVHAQSLLTFTVSATDPDGDPLTYAASELPAGASFNATTHTFSWTPSLSQTGSYQVVFSASDGSLTASQTITITVTGVNIPPVLAPIGNKTVARNTQLTFTVSATDPDGDPLTYSASPLPAGATFNAATRTFSWKPKNTQTGTWNITFSVSDGLATDSKTITITVTR